MLLVSNSCRMVRNDYTCKSVRADMIEDPIANNKNDSCFCNLAVVLDFLTLQHKNNMHTLSVSINLI